ncbi:MAG: peptide ABC transporter substrate-binding protein [Bacteriovoracaceae bacterium]|nr:peptide ABC transporter substrate-binding protein [Bacteriovoracaceae bacterium]
MYKIVVLIAVLMSLVSCQEKKATGSSQKTFSINIQGEPTTINPLTSTDGYAQDVQGYVLETLLDRDIDTYEWKPALAEKWEISPDKKSFTFTLREGVMWDDGKPLTVEDVKYSFDVIFDSTFNTAHIRPYYESVEKLEILDPRTVKFTVKDEYFKNFDTCATLTIIPKHFYTDKNRSKEHNKVLIGTGPYKISQYEKGKRFVLEKKEDWWGRKVSAESVKWNFNRIVLRFIKEENVSLESFKKGDLDYTGLRPEQYMKKTDGAGWGEKLFKVKTVNKSAKGYTFLAWNLKHPILSDKRVREALAMLYNKQLAMEKFEYNLSDNADSPVAPSSDYHSPNIKKIEFNPAQALKVLNSAGWKDTDGDGVLDKVINGSKTKFTVTILEPLADYVKYLTIYKEEAKKVGVEFEIKQIEWNSFVKLLDERKFDAVRLAWGAGSVDPDLKQIWHSASQAGGSNFNNYSNPEVDKLIEKSRRIYPRAERIPVIQKITELIAADHPYLFLFAGKNTIYAHNSRIQKTRDTYNYGVGSQYWTLAE